MVTKKVPRIEKEELDGRAPQPAEEDTQKVEAKGKTASGNDDKIEVFLCVADISRLDYTRKVLEYWINRQDQARLALVMPVDESGGILEKLKEEEGLEGSGITIVRVGSMMGKEGFQRDRRVWAQNMAKGGWYIVSDDDCLPVNDHLVADVRSLLSRHPRAKEFGILSTWARNAKIYPWRPHIEETVRREVYMDSEIWEHVSVGGIRVCQKAAHPEDVGGWPDQPPMDPDGKYRYDRAHADMLRAGGYRVGLMRGVKMIHLGEAVRYDDPEEPDFQV